MKFFVSVIMLLSLISTVFASKNNCEIESQISKNIIQSKLTEAEHLYKQGINYRDGKITGFPKDSQEAYDKAKEYFKSVIDKLNPGIAAEKDLWLRACHNYACRNFDLGHYQEAYKWFENASKQGLAASQENLKKLRESYAWSLEPLIETENFLDKLVIVHMTQHFPKNGLMIAGATLGGRIIPETVSIPSRGTLHFTLNRPAPIESVTYGESIKKYPYCILEPLRSVKDKWYGGTAEDIIVVGDHTLSKDSIILVPQAQYKTLSIENSEFQGRLLEYASHETPYNKAEKYIQDQPKLLKVSYPVPGAREDWFIRILDLETKEEKKILQRNYLTPLWEKRFWGLHIYSRLETVDISLQFLNNAFAQAYLQKDKVYRPNTYFRYKWTNYLPDPEETRRALVLFEYHHNKLLEELKSHSSTLLITKFLYQRYENIKPWLNLIKLDLSLREENKSIYIDNNILQKLIDNRNNVQAYQGIILNLLQVQERSSLESYKLRQVINDRQGYETTDTPIFWRVIYNTEEKELITMIEQLKDRLILDQRTIKLLKADKNWKCSKLRIKEKNNTHIVDYIKEQLSKY